MSELRKMDHIGFKPTSFVRRFAEREIRTRLVVMLTSTVEVPLVDLRGDGPIRIGAPTVFCIHRDSPAPAAERTWRRETTSRAITSTLTDFPFPERRNGDVSVT